MAKTAAVERTVWIAQPRERVWTAITTAQQLEQWFSPGQPWEITALEVGASAIWHSAKDAHDIHIIEVVDPPREFAFRWEPQPPETPLVTTFRLEEEYGGTRVTVTETGFEQLPEDVRQKRMDGNEKGWSDALDSLKQYVEVETT